MSKNRSRQRRPASNPPRSGSKVSITASNSGALEPDYAAQIRQLHDEVTKEATASDRSQLDSNIPNSGSLAEAWKLASEAKQILNMQQQRIEASTKKLETDRKDLEARSSELTKKERLLKERETKAANDEQEIERRKNELKVGETKLQTLGIELAVREANAAAGFLKERDQILATISEISNTFIRNATASMDRISGHETEVLERFQARYVQLERDHSDRLAQQEQEHIDFLADRERLFHQGIAEEREQLDKELNALRQDKEQVEKQRREYERSQLRIDLQEELVQQDRKSVKKNAELLAEARVSDLLYQLESRERTNRSLTQRLKEVQDELRQYEDLTQRIEGRSVEAIVLELKDTKEELQKREAELADRPRQAAVNRLAQLESERVRWEDERAELLRTLNHYEGRLSRQLIGVVELETLRDQRTALEASRKVLQGSLKDLRDDIDTQTRASNRREQFPACIKLDDTPEMQERSQTRSVPDLKTLVTDLQRRMVAATPNKLYYELPDIRSFLAGLASSYLTILQGVSGTGKTSLPIAFSLVMNQGDENAYEKVEVQAGWRDRQDLLGYYNSFEGKYYESKFMQAIYRAQCRRYEDHLFLIILDEMNLSYPEQYFADLLSEMERPDRRRPTLVLMTDQADPNRRVPQHFVDSGRGLPIPPNVRFIGTANQDETTKDLADKTYDRAHIMELPLRPNPLDISHRDLPFGPISYEKLKEAFARAQISEAHHAAKGVRFLYESTLRDFLGRDLGIGWGQRLRRQVEQYAPVVIAAGGSLGEAMDYLLAMQVLRKIRNRFDIVESQLSKLEDEIRASWSDLDKSYPEPSKSLLVIKAERGRLGNRTE